MVIPSIQGSHRTDERKERREARKRGKGSSCCAVNTSYSNKQYSTLTAKHTLREI